MENTCKHVHTKKDSGKFVLIKDEHIDNRIKNIYKVKTVQRRNAFKVFFEFFNCYDILPPTSKLLIIDSKLPLRKTFNMLSQNEVKAALIWDCQDFKYSGILSSSDFMQIINCFHHYGRRDNIIELDSWTIDTWRKYRNETPKLISITVEYSLQEALNSILSCKVRQIPVMDLETGNALHMLNNKRILRYLFKHLNSLPNPIYMEKTVEELKIGTWWNVFTVFEDQKLSEVWNLLIDKRKSSVPVIDRSHNIIGVYSKSDAIKILKMENFTLLDSTVREALKLNSETSSGVFTCSKSETLHSAINTLVVKQIHGLIIVNAESKVTGMLTLSDVMEYISRELA